MPALARLLFAASLPLLGAPGALAAQGVAPETASRAEVGSAPLPAARADELRDLLDLLQLRTGAAPPPIEVRGTWAGDVGRLEEGGPELVRWAERLRDGPDPRPGGGAPSSDDPPFAVGVALDLGGRWGSELLPDPGEGPSARLLARASLADRFGVALDAAGGGWRRYDGVRELVGTVRVAGTVLSVGRTRPRLGPGVDDILLSGTHSLDGIEISSAERLRLPGFLRAIGGVSVSASLRTLPETGAVDDPWYGSMALSLDPWESLRVGLERTAAFGGEGRPAVTAGRVLRMLAGMHSTDIGEFEDQYAQVFVRLRAAPGGYPFLLYGAVAVNDTQGAIRDDPAILGGGVISLAPSGWLGTVRYEYTAFGSSPGLCFWCREDGRPRTWYNHYIYGAHAVDGLPIGSTLGGYGRRHLLRWRGWEGGATWSLGADLLREDRHPTNLLEARWPGERWSAQLAVGLHPRPGTAVDLRVGGARDAEGELSGSLEAAVRWTAFRFGSGS